MADLAMDLAPLEVGLAKLLQVVSGAQTQPVILRASAHFEEGWRSEIEAFGIVRTGAYRDSIHVKAGSTTMRTANASILTDLLYPFVQERGRRGRPDRHSGAIAPRPAGRTAFTDEQDTVIEDIRRELEQLIDATFSS